MFNYKNINNIISEIILNNQTNVNEIANLQSTYKDENTAQLTCDVSHTKFVVSVQYGRPVMPSLLSLF